MASITLKADFLSAREALRRMGGQSYSRLINNSAMKGVLPHPERISCVVSKAQDSLLIELLAYEVKGTEIAANTIAPNISTTSANLMRCQARNLPNG